MRKDPALQEVPSSAYQARYLVSVIIKNGVLKTFSECLGPTDGESAFETYKTWPKTTVCAAVMYAGNHVTKPTLFSAQAQEVVCR